MVGENDRRARRTSDQRRRPETDRAEEHGGEQERAGEAEAVHRRIVAPELDPRAAVCDWPDRPGRSTGNVARARRPARRRGPPPSCDGRAAGESRFTMGRADLRGEGRGGVLARWRRGGRRSERWRIRGVAPPQRAPTRWSNARMSAALSGCLAVSSAVAVAIDGPRSCSSCQGCAQMVARNSSIAPRRSPACETGRGRRPRRARRRGRRRRRCCGEVLEHGGGSIEARDRAGPPTRCGAAATGRCRSRCGPTHTRRARS